MFAIKESVKLSMNSCNLGTSLYSVTQGKNSSDQKLTCSRDCVGIMSRSGKRLRTGEEEGEGEEEDGDFDPMAFYRWILTVTTCKNANICSLGNYSLALANN